MDLKEENIYYLLTPLASKCYALGKSGKEEVEVAADIIMEIAKTLADIVKLIEEPNQKK